jgi:ABC-type antimicrobial peptide transport system permease subunit
VGADVPTTLGNILTPSLPTGCLHGRIAGDRRPQQAVFPSLYRHLLREVTGLAMNFAGLLIAALFICSFEMTSVKKGTKEMHI